MKGDRYVCKACKSMWDTADERRDPTLCPVCGSVNIINLTWVKRKETRRQEESEYAGKRELAKKRLRMIKMESIRNRESKSRHSRARYR